MALEPQPGVQGRPWQGAERPTPALAALRRWLGRVRVGERVLGQCLGARSGLWLARLLTLGFALTAFYTARPIPELRAGIVRLLLAMLSWCAGLAALSAAGPHPERLMVAGRGLFEDRGIALAAISDDRPFSLALWTLRHLGALAMVVLIASFAAANERGPLGSLLGFTLGVWLYLAALGFGLGALARLCQVLAGSRSQTLLAAVVLIPELLAPAWPELPTVAGGYAQLLRACLGVGA